MGQAGAKVRLKDVAEHAGVSVATVSAVMRGVTDGTVRVGPATRRRVERSIRLLGYRPNRAAQSLRTQRSGLIGIVIPDLTNPLFPQFVRASQLRAERDGVHAMIWDSREQPSRERSAVEALLDHQVDGVVLVTEHLEIEHLGPLLAAGMPIAATDARLDHPGVDRVSEDLRAGAYAATQYLVDCGHRRIAHIAGDRASSAGAIREIGYRDALADARLTADERLVVGGESFERAAGYTNMAALAELDEPPEAVLTGNDVLAIGALQACHDLDLRVPHDVAIIGIDNTPEAEIAHPRLTTMDVHPGIVADRLTEIVISRLQSALPSSPVREVVTPTLHRRDSA